MIPSIHAVAAEDPSSMDTDDGVVAVILVFKGVVFSGGNNGRPENPQTAGVVVVWEVVVG